MARHDVVGRPDTVRRSNQAREDRANRTLHVNGRDAAVEWVTEARRIPCPRRAHN